MLQYVLDVTLYRPRKLWFWPSGVIIRRIMHTLSSSLRQSPRPYNNTMDSTFFSTPWCRHVAMETVFPSISVPHRHSQEKHNACTVEQNERPHRRGSCLAECACDVARRYVDDELFRLHARQLYLSAGRRVLLFVRRHGHPF